MKPKAYKLSEMLIVSVVKGKGEWYRPRYWKCVNIWPEQWREWGSVEGTEWRDTFEKAQADLDRLVEEGTRPLFKHAKLIEQNRENK